MIQANEIFTSVNRLPATKKNLTPCILSISGAVFLISFFRKASGFAEVLILFLPVPFGFCNDLLAVRRRAAFLVNCTVLVGYF